MFGTVTLMRRDAYPVILTLGHANRCKIFHINIISSLNLPHKRSFAKIEVTDLTCLCYVRSQCGIELHSVP